MDMLGYWWVIAVAILSTMVAFLSVKSNVSGGLWMYALFLAGMCPIWPIVARYSKNIILDGLIYDAVASIFYIVALLYFSNSFHKISVVQYIAIAMIIGGTFLFKR